MQAPNPKAIYHQQLKTHQGHLTRFLKKRSNLGWLRLVIFLVTVFITYKIVTLYGLVGLFPLLTGIGVLVYLVVVDAANSTKIRNTKVLIQINEEELQALLQQYTNRDEGSRFLPAEHAYAADLDMFGTASVYQWLNRCYTEQGQTLLAANLLHPLSPETIALRHAAVKELTPKIEWRQQWQAFAMQTAVTAATENKVKAWAVQEETFSHPGWKLAVALYSLFTLSTAVATISGYIPGGVFSSLFILYLFVANLISSKAAKPYGQLSGIVKEMTTLQNLITWLEEDPALTTYLKNRHLAINEEGKRPGKEIRELRRILERFDLRNNLLLFVLFNSFLLWDARQIIALNTWRRRNKAALPQWFNAVAEVEVVHSISTLHFNEPSWPFPVVTPVHFILQGKGIGHPLLPDQQRVNNDFTLEGNPKIGLITGSNMAGKSTFLRSLGVNVVLAQLGAPVCAASFTVSPVTLISSMRIADNLAENTSTFYAELKKLRSIIELVKRREPALILLDEILRGTNSFDRHKGSAALIKQLVKEGAVAVLATHDVALADLQADYPFSIDNYHFDVEVEGEELFFDYKLKPGVCKSLNASILMKKIGIDLTE